MELSSEKGGTDFKKNLDFVFFPLGLSNFWVGALFPFDEGQFNAKFYRQQNVTLSKNIFKMGLLCYGVICPFLQTFFVGSFKYSIKRAVFYVF